MSDTTGSPEIATLGINLLLQGKDQVVAGLEQIGAEGEAAATRVQESVARSQQIFATQLATLTQITQGWASSGEEARYTATRLAASLEESARVAGASAEQMQALALAQAAITSGTSGVTDATRAMTLAQNEAIQINDGLTASAGNVVDAYRRMSLAEIAAYQEDDRRTNSVRSLIAAEEAAYATEERRQAATRAVAGAEQAAYQEDQRRQASLRQVAAAEAAAYAEEDRRAASLRRMALLQQEAIELDQARNTGATAGVGKIAALTAAYDNSTGGIGRLRQGMVSLVSQMTGTNAVVDRTVTTLGGLAIGNTAVLAIVAAVAVAGAAYNLLTEDTRKAKEEQDKLTASLDAWYDKESEGPTGALESQIGAKLKELQDLRAEIVKGTSLSNLRENLKASLDVLADLSFNPKTLGDKFAHDWDEYTKRQIAAIQKGGAEVAAAGKAAYEKGQKDLEDLTTTRTTQVGGLVSAGVATPSQVALAERSLEQYRAVLHDLQVAYEGITNEKDKAFNLARQSSAENNIKTTEDDLRAHILKPLQDIEREATLAHDSLTSYLADRAASFDPIVKQLDAFRAVTAADNDAARASEQAARLAGLEGVAREVLTARIKAENEQAAANKTYTGLALDERTRAIQAEYDQAKAVILSTAAIKDQQDAQTALADAVQKAGEIAKRNAKETSDGLKEGLKLYQESEAAASKLAHSIEHDVLNAVVKFSESGSQSFTGFFHVIEQGALRVTEAIGASLEKQRQLYDQAVAHNQSADAAAIAQKIADLKTLQQAVGGISSAIAGGNIGFQVGGLANNQATGAYGGAIAGGLTGYEIAGPLGAAAGALAGAVGGLLGAADAHKAAAKALQDAAKSLATNIAAYTQSNPVSQQLVDNAAKHDALILQAQALAAERLLQAGKDGSKSEGQQAVNALANDTAAIDQGQIDNLKRIGEDFFTGLTQQLNATQGSAGAYANTLNEIDKAHTQNIASVDALAKALGYSTDQTTAAKAQVDALSDALKAAAKAAYDEGQREIAFSLDIRQAYANGLTTIGDLQTRRAQEDKERFDAEQAGWSAADKARLVYIQGLEDEAAALKKLQGVQQTLAQALASGPQGSLASQQAADLQPLLDKQKADQADYDASHAALLDQLDSDTQKYNIDLAAQADATTLATDAANIAADKYNLLTQSVTLASDQAVIDAKKWADAIALVNQAVSDIQRDVSLGFTKNDTGITAEQNAFGFGGLSIDQIKALYTPYTGTPLSNEQEQTDKNIQQFLQDYDKVFGTVNGIVQAVATAVTDATQAAQSTGNPQTEAVNNAAKNLTEATGNRMAAYLSAMLVVEREQLKVLTSGAVRFTPQATNTNTTATGPDAAVTSALSSIQDLTSRQVQFFNSLSATPLPSFDTQRSIAPPTNPSPSLSGVTPSSTGSQRGGSTTVTIAPGAVSVNIHLDKDASADQVAFARTLAPLVVKEVDELLAVAYAERQQVLGNPRVEGI